MTLNLANLFWLGINAPLSDRTDNDLLRAAGGYERVLEIDPENWHALAGLARVTQEQARCGDSLSYWRDVSGLISDNKLVSLFHGYAWENCGNHPIAIEVWQRAGSEVSFAFAGELQRLADNLQLSRTAYNYALEINPDWEPARQGLGSVLRNLLWRSSKEGNDEQRVSLLEELVQISPQPRDFNELGDHSYALGDFPRAAYWYDRGLELFPLEAILHHKLGRVAINKSDFESAERRLVDAIEIDPQLAEAYILLGYVYLKQGRLGEAEVTIRDGINIKPDYAWGYARLGDVYRAMGKNSEARQSYLRALQQSPDMDYARNMLAEMGSGK